MGHQPGQTGVCPDRGGHERSPEEQGGQIAHFDSGPKDRQCSHPEGQKKAKSKRPKKKPAELETTEETLDKKEEENRPIPETNEGDTSMPVLEEETSREDSMDTRERSGSTVEMAEVDMSLERDTESPPEARHRLPLVVAPRESIPSLRRPMPPRPLHSQSPTLPTTSV